MLVFALVCYLVGIKKVLFLTVTHIILKTIKYKCFLVHNTFYRNICLTPYALYMSHLEACQQFNEYAETC